MTAQQTASQNMRAWDDRWWWWTLFFTPGLLRSSGPARDDLQPLTRVSDRLLTLKIPSCSIRRRRARGHPDQPNGGSSYPNETRTRKKLRRVVAVPLLCALLTKNMSLPFNSAVWCTGLARGGKNWSLPVVTGLNRLAETMVALTDKIWQTLKWPKHDWFFS